MRAAEEKFYRARIIHRDEFSPGLWKIRLDTGGEYRFVAGQFATLGVQTQEKLVERAYSIVSSPYEPNLELFIELVPAGELTPLLHMLQSGDEVSLRKVAKGRFTLDLKSGHKNHLLLSTVTGVAPYISYLRTLYKDWNDKSFPSDIHLYLINAASRSWEFGYHQELAQLASQVPWLTYVPSVSRPYEDTEWRGEVGRVEDIVRKYVDLWKLTGAETTGYLCGQPQMIELGKGILFRRGFEKQSLKEEVYWIPPKTLRR
jgi:ferredoxin--NADP+ reductase